MLGEIIYKDGWFDLRIHALTLICIELHRLGSNHLGKRGGLFVFLLNKYSHRLTESFLAV